MRKAVFGGIGAVLLATIAAAQAPPDQRGPRYDASKEVTVKGTIDSVGEVAGRDGRMSVSIELKGDTETLTIRVAPKEFLAERKLALAKGDAIEVIGAKMTFRDREVFRARQIKKGETTVTLLDADGRPAWRPPQ